MSTASTQASRKANLTVRLAYLALIALAVLSIFLHRRNAAVHDLLVTERDRVAVLESDLALAQIAALGNTTGHNLGKVTTAQQQVKRGPIDDILPEAKQGTASGGAGVGHLVAVQMQRVWAWLPGQQAGEAPQHAPEVLEARPCDCPCSSMKATIINHLWQFVAIFATAGVFVVATGEPCCIRGCERHRRWGA